MDFVLGMDVYSQNSPDDKVNARKDGVSDAVTNDLIKKGADWREIIDTTKAAANWKAAYDMGMRYVYIKASEAYIDPGFSARMQFAKDAGFLRGAYILPHFEYDTVKAQAEMFVKAVGSDAGELPPALDLETPNNSWPKGASLFKRVKDMLDRMEAAFGRKPIIYTSQSIVRNFQIINPNWGKDYDMWVAAYPYADYQNKLQYSDPTKPPTWTRGGKAEYPPQPDGYKPWVIWQFSEKGRVNGMGQENVDLDLFDGTYEKFLEWAKAKAPTPNPTPTPDPHPNPAPGPNPQPKPDPVPQPDPLPDDSYVLYTVKQGDTLGSIAQACIKQYGIKKNMYALVDEIFAANSDQIKNKNIVQAGWVLKIPKG